MADQHYTVEQLLELAHKHRALHIKVGPLEVQLDPSAFEAAKPAQASDLPTSEKPPSPEEMLYLASGIQVVPPDFDDGGN